MQRSLMGPKAIQAIGVLLVLGFLFGYVDDRMLMSIPTAAHGRSVSIVDKTKSINPCQNSTYCNTTQMASSKKSLPSFENGGVVLFLHIPKTGGTTIRKGFQHRNNVTYLFSNRRAKYETLVDTVDEWVKSGPRNNQIGVLEVHVRNNPTLLELCQRLQQWRETANRNQVPFFAFTILREPVSFAISYFNYYHGIQWERRRFEYLPLEAMTEANFLRTMHFNPQCLFLARSEQAYQRNHPEMRENLTKSECDRAYECLKANMDWIGSTERLRNETIPLVSHVLGGGGSYHNSDNTSVVLAVGGTPQDIKLENAGPKIFGIPTMSGTTLEQIQKMTEWDEEMYRNVLHEYNFDSFELV